MNYEEFYKKLIFLNRKISVPLLGITIDKNIFIGNKGYDLEEQNKFLKKLYDDNLDRLSKQ